MNGKFSTTVTINSNSDKVWTTLTDLELMTQWLGDPEMKIEVQTDWKINSPIFIRGFHHVKFENKGIILHYDREKNLAIHTSVQYPDLRIYKKTIQHLNLH
jgi:uncharacterized protein YndB with AHSA1/START domain